MLRGTRQGHSIGFGKFLSHHKDEMVWNRLLITHQPLRE